HGGDMAAVPHEDAGQSPFCDGSTACPVENQLVTRLLDAAPARGPPAEATDTASTFTKTSRLLATGLSAAQAANTGMGIPQPEPRAALAAAPPESGLGNPYYGETDSSGPFGQRPWQGWGSPRQISNPTYAATGAGSGTVPASRGQSGLTNPISQLTDSFVS